MWRVIRYQITAQGLQGFTALLLLRNATKDILSVVSLGVSWAASMLESNCGKYLCEMLTRMSGEYKIDVGSSDHFQNWLYPPVTQWHRLFHQRFTVNLYKNVDAIARPGQASLPEHGLRKVWGQRQAFGFWPISPVTWQVRECAYDMKYHIQQVFRLILK